MELGHFQLIFQHLALPGAPETDVSLMDGLYVIFSSQNIFQASHRINIGPESTLSPQIYCVT